MQSENKLVSVTYLLDKIKFDFPAIDVESKCIKETVNLTREIIMDAPTVDAVEVVQIEEVKKEILQTLDSFIDKYRPWVSESNVYSYYGGQLDAFEIARRLVNAALTDLCGEDENKCIM